MIKILHLISTLDRGGAETTLYRLVSRMDHGLFEDIVVSMTDIGPIGKKIQAYGVPVYSLKMKKGFPDPRGILPFCRFVQQFKPEIIQCWMYHANLLGLLCIRNRKCIWNIRVSEIDLTKYGIIYSLAVKAGAYVSRVPYAVIVNSWAGKTSHEGLGYQPKRWEVIPNGFDTTIFRPDPDARKEIRSQLGIPQDAVVIGLVARLDPIKDHENFFNAVRIALRGHPQVHFVLAGKGVILRNSTIENFMQGLENKENIHLLGERDDMPRVFAAMDIATSSSWGEGFPNTIGEAMAAGVACVVTDVGDSRSLVDDTGTVVAKKDPVGLAQGWQSLIDADPALIRDMGKRARKRIKQHYSIDSMVQKYEEVYQKLGVSA